MAVMVEVPVVPVMVAVLPLTVATLVLLLVKLKLPLLLEVGDRVIDPTSDVVVAKLKLMVGTVRLQLVPP